MADFAGSFQRLQRAHGLVMRRHEIGPVDEHQVDIVRVESPQATFRVLRDTAGRSIAPHDRCVAANSGIIADDKTYFCHQNDILAPLAQTARQQLFRGERSVNFGGIEEGDAVVDGHVNGAHGLVHVDLAVLRRAQLPGAEPSAEQVKSVLPNLRSSIIGSSSISSLAALR